MKSLNVSILVVGLASLTMACEEPPPPPKKVIRPVRTQTVASTDGRKVLAFSGASQASVASQLSFKVSGQIAKVKVKVGDEVKKGAEIARLDTTEFDIRIQSARANVSQARAQARNAESQYQRIKKLYATRNAAKQDLDNARAQAASAKAMVNAAAQELKLANTQKGYTVLKAPEDLAVASVNVEINENVQAGQAIVQMSGEGPAEVQVSVPGALISDLQKGMAGQITFGALPGKTFEGELTELGVASTGGGNTFPAVFTLKAQTAEIRPGMSASVKLELGGGEAAQRYVVVPPVAVREDQKGRYVFVAVPTDGKMAKVERREVRVGELMTEGLQVIEGLEDGQHLIIAGVSRINPGQQVKLMGVKE